MVKAVVLAGIVTPYVHTPCRTWKSEPGTQANFAAIVLLSLIFKPEAFCERSSNCSRERCTSLSLTRVDINKSPPISLNVKVKSQMRKGAYSVAATLSQSLVCDGVKQDQGHLQSKRVIRMALTSTATLRRLQRASKPS